MAERSEARPARPRKHPGARPRKKPKARSEALSVRLLGEIQASRGGERLPLPASKKTRALLAYLVVDQRPHRRERLCSMLWDVTDDPRGALRWSLSKLRALVDEPERPRIVADRDGVAFDGAGVSVDLLRDPRRGGRRYPSPVDGASAGARRRVPGRVSRRPGARRLPRLPDLVRHAARPGAAPAGGRAVGADRAPRRRPGGSAAVRPQPGGGRSAR